VHDPSAVFMYIITQVYHDEIEITQHLMSRSIIIADLNKTIV